MSIKIGVLKLKYKSCPKCGGNIEEYANFKVLLNKTFKFLRCKTCNWKKG